MFVLANAFFIWLADGVNGQEVCGLFNLLVNLAALWVFYLLTRRFHRGRRVAGGAGGAGGFPARAAHP